MIDKRYLLKGIEKINKKKGKIISLEINKDCGITTGHLILEKLGYNYLDSIDNISIYEKNDRLYRFISMDHFNSFVYNIKIKEVL